MPSNATDTDVFPANVQRPNNGETADAASLSQGFNPVTQRTRYVYNRMRSRIYDVTRSPYSADATGTADSQAAFQAAIDAASVAGGGTVVVPDGTFKLNSGLSLPRNVSLEATDHALIYLNHASADLITFTTGDAYTGGVSRISGFTFAGLVTNTGTVIKDPSASDPWSHLIERCAFNFSGSSLQGALIEQLGATEITIRNCYLAGRNSSTTDVIRQSNANAVMNVLNNRIVSPSNSTWAANLINAANGVGVASGNRFDMGPITGNNGVVFRLGAASKPWRVIGNEFIGPIGGYSVAGFSWATLAMLTEHGNTFNGTTMRAGAYPSSSVVGLNYGSSLGSLGHSRSVHGAVGSIAVPYGARSVVIACGASSGPALTMPLGYHDGQELLLTYYNSSLSTVTPTFASTPVTGTTVPPVLPGNTLTGVFVWEDRSGTGLADRWIQKGTWGVGLTLV